MDRRLSLHQELKGLLGNDNCYYQPPESLKLKYDCIVYNLSSANVDRANNETYLFTRRYNVTLITKDPDNPLIETIVKHFKRCSFNNHYTKEHLNCYNYTLYY